MRRLVAASKALTSQRTPNQSDPHQRSWIFFKQLAERVRIGRLSVITVGEKDQSSFPLGLNPGEVLEARTVTPMKERGLPECSIHAPTQSPGDFRIDLHARAKVFPV